MGDCVYFGFLYQILQLLICFSVSSIATLSVVQRGTFAFWSMPPISDTENSDAHSDEHRPMRMDSSSSDDDSISGDSVFAWSGGLNSLTRLNLVPKNGDYSIYKDQLKRDLHVGSSYYLGTKEFPLNSVASLPRARKFARYTMDLNSSIAFTRHPLFLIRAREDGTLGPSSKSKRLLYKSTSWRVTGRPRPDGLQCYGNRAKGAFHTDPQTFEEAVTGSTWAVSRLHLTDRFKCHRGCVNTLCFNASGNLIASGSDDTKVVITEWFSKNRVAKYDTGHTMNIFHVKFLPETNDTKLVSCACDSEVRLAELTPSGSLASGCTRLLVSHDRSCHKLALPNGEPNVVLSAGADGQVFSIDVRVPKAENILWLPYSEFFSIACNPVRPYEVALCGRSESIVRIFDRRKMTNRDPKSGYLHFFGADHLRPGGAHSAVDLQMDLMNVSMNDELPRERSGAQADSDDEADESSGLLGSLSAQLGRRVRDVLNGLRDRSRLFLPFSSLSQKPESSPYSVTAAVYTNQGDAILASYNDEDIYLFDVRRPSKPYLHRYSGHRNMQTIVSATFFGPNSEYIASGSDDGFFYIWDRESEGIVQWLYADSDGAVNVVESHPTLPILATAGLDYDFKIWAPIRPILNDEDDPSYGPELKYVNGEIPASIRRLRNSRLAKALFPVDPESAAPMIGPIEPPSLRSGSTAFANPSPSNESAAPTRKRRRRRASSSSSSSSCSSDEMHPVQASTDAPSGSSLRPNRTGKRHHKHGKSPKLNHSNSQPTTGTDDLSPPVMSSLSDPWFPPTPFNVRDLQLRVAQNWINRTCERDELANLDDAESRIMSALVQIHNRSSPRSGDEEGNENETRRRLVVLRHPTFSTESFIRQILSPDGSDSVTDHSSVSNLSTSSSSSSSSDSNPSSPVSNPLNSAQSGAESQGRSTSSSSSSSSSSTLSSPQKQLGSPSSPSSDYMLDETGLNSID